MSDPRSTERRRFLQGAALVAAGFAWANSAEKSGGAEESRRGILDAIVGDPKTGMSRAVVVGNYPLVHTEQVFSKTSDTGHDLEIVMQDLGDRLRGAGASPADVVRLHFYVASNESVPSIQSWLAKQFPGEDQPAVTFVTGKLAQKGSSLAADCVAVRREKIESGKVVRTTGAAVLPPRDKLYVSGDAKPGDIPTATLETLKSLENTLAYTKLDWSHVVQLKSFLQPIEAADEVRTAMKTFFGERPLPVLTFVEWSSASLPIEIELIAAVPPEHGNASHESVEYLTPPTLKPSPVFSRAARVRSEKTIYTSGLYGERATDTPGRVREILATVRDLTTAAGGDLRHLVKATYYVSDADSSEQLNKLRPEFYDPQRPPAASKAITSGVGREGHHLTVDMIAVPRPRG